MLILPTFSIEGTNAFKSSLIKYILTCPRFGLGPWWWSSGHRARLLHRQSEFESMLTSTVFSVKFVLEKNQNKQKVGCPVFLKKDLDFGTERCGRNLRWSCSPRIKIDYEINLKTD